MVGPLYRIGKVILLIRGGVGTGLHPPFQYSLKVNVMLEEI